MKLTLRNLALGAAMLATGAVTAQDAPTVTQRWIEHIPADIVGNVRSGAGFGGKVYVSAGPDLYAIDGTNATKVFTSATSMNKGFAMDEAGNIVVAAFPTSATNWMNVQLIKASDWTATSLELALPAETQFAGNRYDVVGRAVGDFFSEKGGVFYITANTQTYPIPVWIANGKVVELTEPAHPTFGAANSMACAQPKATIDEMDEENVFYNYYYYTGSSTWNIGYTTEDFEALYLPSVAEGQMPEGWASQTQNGFDVFTLGDKTYAVRMSGAGQFNSNFLIHDMDGNVLFHTDYGEGWNNPATTGNTGNGCGVWARKVSDNKVELYQVFKCGVADNSFVALYDIELSDDVPPTTDDANFVKVTTIEDGESYALVGNGKYTAELFSKTYGYFGTSSLPEGAGDAFYGNEAGALKFTAVDGGYNITTSAGKFMGAKSGYNTFDTSDASADNRVWTVSFNADGTAVIVNVATGKTIAMDTQYGSFGCYDQSALEGKVLPAVFKYTGGEVVPPTPDTATFELVNAVSDGEFVFVVDGKVGEAIAAGDSYGRLSLVEATFDGNKVTTAVGNTINIAAAKGGYTLQDANGRYLGFDGTHTTSFQLYTEVNEYTVWAIAMTNDEATITMTVGEKTGTVGVTKGSEGTWFTNIAPSVGADEIMLPKLYKKGGSSSVETITVDQNAPVEYFNLQGIRVENPANGLYIRRQGNSVSKVYINK